MATTVTVTSKREHTATDAGRDGSLKGLVLSGGKGSRLRPFTYTNAKQLVPIANKPVIFYTIEQLVEAGITEIGIVVGDTGDQVAVATARDFLGDSPFVLYLGDNFVMGGIQSYVDKFTANGSCSQILLHPVANPEAFGIAEMSAGRVTRIVEKPRNAQSNLAVVGIYMFDRSVHDVIGGLSPSWRGELEITDAIQGLIDRGFAVDAEVMDRYWIDTGKMDDMLNANRMVLSAMEPRCDGSIDDKCQIHAPVVIESGATVEDSVLRGPPVIGRDTAIVNSYVGPNTSIDARCRIVGCRIEDSIVMEDSRLERLHWPVAKSMIGRFVELHGGHNLYSLTLGDYSRIEMPDG